MASSARPVFTIEDSEKPKFEIGDQAVDWQNDPDFKGLPLPEKHKALLQIDPDYAGLPPQEQSKALNTIHYGAGGAGTGQQLIKSQTPAPADTGVLGRVKQYGKALGGIASGMLNSSVGPTPDFSGVAPLALADAQRAEEGRSTPYRVLAGGAGIAGIDPTGMEESARHGDPAGVLVNAAAQGTPVAASELARTPMAKKGITAGVEGAKDLASRAGDSLASTLREPATARQSQLGRPGTVKKILPSTIQRTVLPEGLIPKGELGTPTNPGPFSEIPAKMPKARPLEAPLGSPENPGLHSKIPTGRNSMPKPKPAPVASPFEGMTSSAGQRGDVELPPTPTSITAAQEMPLVRSKAQVAKEVGPSVSVFPEPREPLAGDRPGAMWSVGREEVLPEAARRGAPGAGDVLRNIGNPIIYTPKEGVGYEGPHSRTGITGESSTAQPASQGITGPAQARPRTGMGQDISASGPGAARANTNPGITASPEEVANAAKQAQREALNRRSITSSGQPPAGVAERRVTSQPIDLVSYNARRELAIEQANPGHLTPGEKDFFTRQLADMKSNLDLVGGGEQLGKDIQQQRAGKPMSKAQALANEVRRKAKNQ